VRWLVLVLALAACSRAPSSDGWTSHVAELNAEADRLLDVGDRAGAARLLTAVADEPAPSADLEVRRALVQDARFRLARLALETNDADAALRHADAGLALGARDDLFTANLLVARGAAREARHETQAALDDYQRALRINQHLLEETLR
jgi:tetratricopeptide (TPR) repeat protein